MIIERRRRDVPVRRPERPDHEAQQAAPLKTALASLGDVPARIAMVECLIAGMIMTRYIYRLEPARSLPAAAFEEAVARSVQHAITGPVTIAR